jgi:hypothetical protein
MTTEPRTHHARVRLVERESPGQTTHTTLATHKATHAHARQVKKSRSNHARAHARTTHRLTTHVGGVYLYPPCAVVLQPPCAAVGSASLISPHVDARTRAYADWPVSERSRKNATVMDIIGGSIWPLTCGYAFQAWVLTGKRRKSPGRLALVKEIHKPLAGLPASTVEVLP